MNLEQLSAEYGYKFAYKVKEILGKKAEAFLTKALGVLQEQGLYAYVLFCKSRGDKENQGANKIIIELTRELFKEKLKIIGDGDLLEEIRKENGLTSNLENLVLAIQILEKTLIYARYHAKAEEEIQQTDPTDQKVVGV